MTNQSTSRTLAIAVLLSRCAAFVLKKRAPSALVILMEPLTDGSG